MKWVQLIAVAGLGLAAPGGQAHPPGSNVSFGIHLGTPVYPRPWCGYYPGVYYRPYPLYYYPPPPRVIVEPAPIIVQQHAPIVVAPPPPSVAVQPSPSLVPTANVVVASSEAIDRHLQLLTSPDELVRRDAVMDLGRLKAEGALDPLAATLAGDKSPVVRDAAARALGLIAAPRSLAALTHAAQADTDRDVRRSAQFAVEVIQANLRSR